VQNTTQVEVLDPGKAGRCVLCGLDVALVKKVVYYRRWSYPVCRTCAQVVQRHVRWLAEARRRHLQNRARVAQDGE